MSASAVSTKRGRHKASRVAPEQKKRVKVSSAPTILLSDLLLLIFAAVPSDALIGCALVCHQWRELIFMPTVWRSRSFSLDEIVYRKYESGQGHISTAESARRKHEKCAYVQSFVRRHAHWLQHVGTLIWPFATYLSQVKWSAVSEVMHSVTSVEYDHYKVNHSVGAALSSLRHDGRLKRLHLSLEHVTPSLVVALDLDLLQPLSTATPYKLKLVREAVHLAESRIKTSRSNDADGNVALKVVDDNDSVVDVSLSLRAGFIESQLTTSMIERVGAIHFKAAPAALQTPIRLIRLQRISGAITVRLLEQLRTIVPTTITSVQIDGPLDDHLAAMAFLQPTLTSLTVDWNSLGDQASHPQILQTLTDFTHLQTLHIRREGRSNCAAFNRHHLAALPRTLTELSFPFDETELDIDDLASLSDFTRLTHLKLIGRYLRHYGRWTQEILDTIATATRTRQLKLLSLEAYSLSNKNLTKRTNPDVQLSIEHWQTLLNGFIDQNITTLILRHSDMKFTPYIRQVLRQCIVQVKEVNSDDVKYSV